MTNNLTALGSSSMMSTVEDMARWVINFDSMRVGGAQAMALTRTRGVLNDGSTIPYAFGVSHGEYRGAATVNHSGSWAGFVTYVLHVPQHRFGVVVLANAPQVNPTRAAQQVTDVLLGSALAPLAAATEPPVVQLPAATLDAYAGTYKLGPGWYAQVRRDGNGLTVQASGEGVGPMVARSEQELWVPNYGASMTFQRDGTGRVTGLLYRERVSPRMPDREPALWLADQEANVVLTASTKIIDVTGSEPVEYRGYVPERCVVIPGTMPKEFAAGTYHVPCALIIGRRKESTDQKTSLNDALREFQVAV